MAAELKAGTPPGGDSPAAAVGAYLPLDRRQALADGRALPDRAHGAALFADVSGFSAMTHVLVKELGRQRGPEEMSRHLNRVFEALIAEVYRYGGSVVVFSGDAVTCWFDGDDGRRATACALGMQNIMSGLDAVVTPQGTVLPLAIKVSVTAGAARRLLVGSVKQQRFEVLAGAVVDWLAAAEQQTGQGEVTADAGIAAALSEIFVFGEGRQSGNGEPLVLVTGQLQAVAPQPWPELQAMPATVSRPWLMPALYDRLERGEGEFLADLRTAVAVFIQFSGIDYERDDASEHLNSFVKWSQRSLAHYGGSLLGVIVGEKGSYLYAVFGAPVAYEDDARRAVTAAVEFQSAPAALPIISSVQIGVSRGQVWTGAYGARLRRTYGVQGDEVNIAARLMTKAKPGEILVTETLFAATDHEYKPLAPMMLKGVSEPVAVYVLRPQPADFSATRPARAQVPMVGRESERQLLLTRLRRLRQGQGGVVLIEGEPGIGKSRLVAYLLQQAEEQGISTLTAVADAVEQTRAYHAWIPAYRELFHSEAESGAQELRRQVMAALASEPRLAERSALLNAVLPLNLPESELTSEMSGEVRAGNTQELLVFLLAHAPGQKSGPRMIVVEDAQWLDSASWALLDRIRRDLPQILLALAIRSHAFTNGRPAPPEYDRLLAAPDTEYVRLNTLTREETTNLARQQLGVTELPPHIGELIHEQAEGHPFYAVEIANALRDAGALELENGSARLTREISSLEDLEFPGTIQGVITSRIDRLAPPQQLALKVASVIGREFPLSALSDIYPVEADKPALAEHLRNLDRLDITLMERPDPDSSYIFKHIIIQEVAYGMLLYAQRQQLHKAAAEWLESQHSQDLSPYCPLLAHHWQRAAGDVATAEPQAMIKTINYLDCAGQQAQEQFAERETIRFVQEAITLADAATAAGVYDFEQSPASADYVALAAGTPFAPATLQRATRELQLGDAYLGLGQLVDSRLHYEQALALFGQEVATGRVRSVLNMLGQSWRQLWHRLLPARLTRRQARLAQNDNLRQIALSSVRAYERLMKVFYYANEGEAFISAGLNGLNLAETAGPSADLARIYANMSTVAGIIPLHPLARLYGRLALETATTVDSRSALGWALLSTSVYNVGAARWQEADEALAQAAAIYDRLGDLRQWEETLAVSLTLFNFHGQFERSAQASRDLYASAIRRNDPQTQAWGLVGQVENLLRLDKMDEGGQALLEPMRALLNSDIGQAERIWIRGLLALSQWRTGDREGALAEAQECERLLLPTTPTAVYTLEGFVDVAEIYLALWRQQGATAALGDRTVRDGARRICAALHSFARRFPVARPVAWRMQASCLWQDGKQAAAGRAWIKALAAAVALEMPYEQGMTALEYGLSLAANVPERRQRLEQARALLASAGASYDLARAETALAGG